MLVSCPVVTEFWKIFLEWYETLTAAKLELSTVKISLASISVARTKVALSLQGLSLAKSLGKVSSSCIMSGNVLVLCKLSGQPARTWATLLVALLHSPYITSPVVSVAFSVRHTAS